MNTQALNSLTQGEEGVYQLEQTWRRILLASFPLALMALGLEGFQGYSSGQLNFFNQVSYSLIGIFAMLNWIILTFYKRALQPITISLITGTSLYFVSKFIYLLFVSSSPLTQTELSNTFYWTPIIYLLCFLVSGEKLSRRLAFHFTLSGLWVSLVYAYLNRSTTDLDVLQTLNILLQGNLSQGVQLILSFSFFSLKNYYHRSQNQIQALDLSVHTDVLTRLPNRLYFQTTLETALQEAQKKGTRVAVFFIDLDRFKLVNDTLGHQIGDRLLEMVSQRLQNTLRPEDFVARISGDEFVVISRDLEKTNLVPLIAQRLLDVFASPFEVFGQTLNASASIGVSIFPDDAYEADLLLRHADSAMYSVKKQGKNGFMTYQQTDSGLERRWQLEKDLKVALEQGQFKLYYQPLYNLHSGDLVKLEALVRWEHPEQGVISPAEFISVAEESGQILTLGAWVLDEACRQGKIWNIQGRFKMAVNVSALQFSQPNFLITVMNALKESGLPGYALELELTESIVIGQPEMVQRTLLELKDLGIQLAIDDFGTGYSSLAYLRDLPIDTIKIDKSFIQDLDAKDKTFSRALVETITSLARSLKLEVVAEGVETEAQCVLLRKLGCQVGQGYYFAKPIPAEKVEALINNMLHRPTLMALTAIKNPEKELVSKN